MSLRLWTFTFCALLAGIASCTLPPGFGSASSGEWPSGQGPVVDEVPSDGSAEAEAEADGDETAAVPSRFDVNRLLDDRDLEGGQALSTDDVQAFLEEKGSFLAGYVDDSSGYTAAALITLIAEANRISPLYLLARIQAESGLVTSETGDHLATATGCGCADGTTCSDNQRGFGQQVQCAAEKMRSYLDDLDASGVTTTGLAVGVPNKTLDPCDVTPENRATAALYTYTPWVGGYGEQCHARPDVGGASLLALVFHRFGAELRGAALGFHEPMSTRDR